MSQTADPLMQRIYHHTKGWGISPPALQLSPSAVTWQLLMPHWCVPFQYTVRKRERT